MDATPIPAGDAPRFYGCPLRQSISHANYSTSMVTGKPHCLSCGHADVQPVNLAAAHQAQKRAAQETP